MQAIQTKYLPATNTKGSRIKATAEGATITIGYPHEFNEMEAHAVAALALCKKMGWAGDLIGGGLENTYVFVFTYSSRFCRFTNPYVKGN